MLGNPFEALKFGACKAPFHKVVLPEPGTGARYSVTVFTYAGFDISMETEGIQEQLAKIMDGVSTAKFPVDQGHSYKVLTDNPDTGTNSYLPTNQT